MAFPPFFSNLDQAITWAVEKWDVDIISISWGINEESNPIREAIIKARQNNIIILASASNEGSNRPITFPANIGYPIVFCIGAADATGTRSNFSPPAKRMEKFSAIGEAVINGRHFR